MAGNTQGDRLLEIEKLVARLEERVETIRGQIGGLPEFGIRVTTSEERIESVRSDVVRLSTGFNEVVGRIQETEKQQRAIAEKKLEELRSRRWDLFKLFLAALLGSALTLASSVVSKVVERMSESRPSPTTKK